MYEVPDKGTVKSEILHHLPVAKRGYDSKRWLGGSYSMRSPHKQKTTWQRPITSAFAWCCSRCLWARCLVTARAGRYKRTGFPYRWPLARVYSIIGFVWFSAKNLTLWVSFPSPIAHLAAKNRFSRGFVSLQIGVSSRMRKNEYLLQQTGIYTRFRAICS